jgi:hypothetical protein
MSLKCFSVSALAAFMLCSKRMISMFLSPEKADRLFWIERNCVAAFLKRSWAV